MPALGGLRIVITRSAEQAEELAAPLRAQGAKILLLPAIAIEPPLDWKPLHDAASHAARYDWIIFTSANAVHAFAREASSSLGQTRIAAVGAATRQAAEQHGFSVALTPDRYVAESLVEAFAAEPLAGKRVLLPGAAVRRDVVAQALSARGAQIDTVEAYRTVMPRDAAARAAQRLRDPLPDWITFASASAVDNTVQAAGRDVLARINIASIGPVTSDAVRRHRLAVAAEASPHTVEGLVAAMLHY